MGGGFSFAPCVESSEAHQALEARITELDEARTAGRVRCAARQMQELANVAAVGEEPARAAVCDAQHCISTLSGMVETAERKSALLSLEPHP